MIHSSTSHPIPHFRFSPFCLSATQRWTFSLFIHPSSHCCSTSSRNEIIPLFSDSIRISKSADRSVSSNASLAMNRCLHRFHQENDLHITRWTVNVFDYILLAILTSNRSFGHLRWAKNARNLHIHQLHSLESIYSSCISYHPIRNILWWERCWSWVWWM